MISEMQPTSPKTAQSRKHLEGDTVTARTSKSYIIPYRYGELWRSFREKTLHYAKGGPEEGPGCGRGAARKDEAISGNRS